MRASQKRKTEAVRRPGGGMGRRKKSSSLMREADRLFSLIVRAKGHCVVCGYKQFLQCAHGFSRSYHATRWDEENAWCLCRADHVYYTHRPAQWNEFMEAQLGRKRYKALRDKAIAGGKTDYKALLAQLRVRAKEVGVD